MHRFGWIVIAAVVATIAGCVVNPATGKRELGLVSMDQQIAIGAKNYVPAQQMQGGVYQVDPALSTYVNSVGQKVAAASGVALPYEFVVLNNSVPNAWALPGGKIAINRGLLTELRNEAELAAVLGHEAAHATARHGAKAMERGLLLQGALIAAMIGTRNNEYAQTLVGVGQVAAGLVTQKFGRDAEREADFYGTRYMAKAGYDPHAAVTLQETFVRLSENRQTNWIQGLFSSHPPSQERVANNRTQVDPLKAEFPQASAFGGPALEKALVAVRRDAKAYASYDDARKALKEGDIGQAIALVSSAIEAQPREAHFHGLRGDIRYRQKRFADARRNYDRALDRGGDFFAHFIGRGMSNKALKRLGPARADLEKSLELLPTAVAYQALGEVAEAQGDQDAAVEYYQAASEAQGDAGRTAMASLLRLDVPRQPGKYVRTAVRAAPDGGLLLQVANVTQAPLYGVVVQVDLLLADGRQTRVPAELSVLQAAANQVLSLPAQGAPIVQARATVVSASAERS